MLMSPLFVAVSAAAASIPIRRTIARTIEPDYSLASVVLRRLKPTYREPD